MAAESAFLRDLAIVMSAAAATALLFYRLRAPVVLGYILAGFLVGPFSFVPGLRHAVSGAHTVTVLGELGIVFLLFALGLEFNLRKLRRVGATALIAGVLEIAVMIWLGYTIGRALGWDPMEAIFLGAIVSISSTTIIVKVLTASGQKDEEWARVVFGILIIEDIVAVLLLATLSTAAASGGFDPALLTGLAVKLAVFLTAALVLGLVVVPRLVGQFASVPQEEVLVVGAVGLAFGLSLLAGELGLSSALGAFLMGALISESHAAERVTEKVEPLRDMFTAVFFVSVGMLIEPSAIVGHWPLILLLAVAVMVGKLFAVSFATFIAGHAPQTSLRTGLTMGQIGEFSFIIAALGLTLGVTDEPIYPIAISVSAITAFTTPVLIRQAPRFVHALETGVPKPLSTYAGLYHGWVKRLGRADRSDPEWRAIRRHATRSVAHGTVVLALVASGSFLADDLEAFLGLHALPLVGAQVAGGTVLAFAAVPFAYAGLRHARLLIDALATAAVPQRFRQEEAANPVIVRVLRTTFTFFGAVFAGALILLALSPFLPSLPLLVAVLALVGAALAVFWRSILRVNAHVERALEEALADEPEGTRQEAAAEALELIRTEYPWEAATREVRVEPASRAAEATLAELDVRAATGTSVLSVRRGGEHLHNPPADLTLLPGDRLLLLGERGQLDAAEALLTASVPRVEREAPAPSWHEVAVPVGAALAGQTLAAAKLRDRAGVNILGIRRADEPVTSPRPDMTLHEGDVLLVLATPRQVRLLQEALAGKPPVKPEPEASGL